MTRRIFALVGDTHADADRRLDEHNKVMRWIAWDAKGRGAQALFHSGDLYERASNSLEREAVASWVMTAAGLMQVVILRGNHDDPRDIEALGHLRTKYPVHVDTRPGPLIPLHAYTAGGEYAGPEVLAWIAVLPWPEKTHLLAGREQTSRAQGDADAVTALRNILRDYGERFAALEHDTSPRIFLGHCMMRGSSVGISQPPLVGADFELGIEDLEQVGADFYALGHIHLGQDWVLENNQQHSRRGDPPIVYPGSPRRMNFGETEEKSYVLMTFDDRTLVSWERIATPCRKMIHLTGGYGVVDGLPECFLDAAPPDMDEAEVRLRYEVKPEERVAARAAAQSLASALRAQGAAQVVIEEVVTVEQRARAPEVAAAATNRDRLWEHWRSKGIMLEGQGRVPEVLAKLEALEVSLAETSLAPKLGAIRFRRQTLKGFGPFERELDVRFDQLDGKLTAVTGRNGAGKSTLLEALIGGIYRRCPTRGDLINMATSRSACLQIEFDSGGHSYYVKQLVDSVSRKSEAVITRDGEPVVRSTKVSAVQEYVDRNLPSLDLQLVSTFAAQKSRGFLDTKPSERKALLLQVRGVDQLQELAGLARLRATSESDELSKLDYRLSDRRAQCAALAETEAQLAKDQAHLLQDVRLQENAEALVSAATEANARSAVRVAARKAHLAQRAKLRELLSGRHIELDNIELRQRRSRELVMRAPAIRRAATRLAELQEERGRLTTADVVATAGLSECQGRRRQLEEARRSVTKRIGAGKSALSIKGAVENAIRLRPEARQELAKAMEKREQVLGELRALESQHLADAGERITGLRSGLVAIRDGAAEPAAAAGWTLQLDDEAVAKLQDLPAQTADKSGELGQAEREVRDLENRVAALHDAAEQLPLVQRAEADLETARADLARLTEQLEQVAADEARLSTEAEARKAAQAAVQTEWSALRGDAIEAAALERAEAALEELALRATATKEAISESERELTALGETPEEVPLAELPPLEAEVSHMQAVIQNRRERITRLTEQTSQMKLAAADVEKLSGQRAARLLELSDWQRLVLDLGKDGLQAALSDAALPEFVALTNTLLHSSFGPRFTVDVRSQKSDSTGKRLLETLDVIVIDTGDAARGIAGREALAETYSGGELTIIGEALSLALTVLACRSSDGTPPTLVRDEAGAALDPANGRAWIAMLRRAVDMVGADRLLFVSHSPELTALADSRVEL